MSTFQCCSRLASGNFKTYPKLICVLACCLCPLTTYAGWYAGGALLLHPFPYRPVSSNYINLGSSRVSVLANGIAINGGYRFCINRYILSTELDLGGFSDADGDLEYKGVKHYVSASYYMALKQKIGFRITNDFVLYGLLGLSQNSIGDRVYSTGDYFNKKQVSFLSGLGLEYFTRRDSRISLFGEGFYFTPTNMTLYSGGAKPPPGYSLSAKGAILQFGMRYYFE